MATSRMSRMTPSMATEAEDLAFRYRTLLAARRILDAEFRLATHPRRDELYVERLRRLRTYLRNSIASIERRMVSLGMELPDADSEDDVQDRLPQVPSPVRAEDAGQYGPSSQNE